MEKVLVISNCNTVGLVNSLSLLNPEMEITGVDIGDFVSSPLEFMEKFQACWRVVAVPSLDRIAGVDFSGFENIDLVPSPVFSAYHPDLCMVIHDGRELAGPLTVYHSAIAFAAYTKGLDASTSKQFFNGSFYEQLGYFERWTADRDALLGPFGICGLDLTSDFRRWSRGECFMYTLNHPKIRVIYDIAAALTRKWGFGERRSGPLPHDNLAVSAVFPVYSELAEALGVEGSYLFKRPSEYRLIALDEYLVESFDMFSRYDPATLTVNPAAASQVELIRSLI